jgi:hypothetical protein
MDLSVSIDAPGIGHLLAAMRFKGLFGGDHKFVLTNGQRPMGCD